MKPDRLPFAALLVAATAAALGCADHGIIGPTPGPDAVPVFQASATSKKGGGNGGVPSCSTVLVGMIRQTVGPAGRAVPRPIRKTHARTPTTGTRPLPASPCETKSC